MTFGTFFKTVLPKLGEHVPSSIPRKQTGGNIVKSVPIKPPEDWHADFKTGKSKSHLVDELVLSGSSQQSDLLEKVALPDLLHEQLKFPPHYFNEEHRPVATWDEPPLPGHP